MENKPIDKEKQKKKEEDPLESIRSFNQINEEFKKSYDGQIAKTKQPEKIMRESMLGAEAKYLKDEDGESSRDGESCRDRESSGYRESSKDGESSRDRESSGDKESSKDGESSKDRDKDSNSDSDSDSSDEDVYSKKPKTNSSKIRCEERNEELSQKDYGRHIQ